MMINIVNEQVECFHPLLEAFLQLRPFIVRNDARDDIERDQALGAGIAAIDGEGDADAPEHEVGLDPLAFDDVRRLVGQPALEFPVVRADLPPGVRIHLIEKAGHACCTLFLFIVVGIATIKKCASASAVTLVVRDQPDLMAGAGRQPSR